MEIPLSLLREVLSPRDSVELSAGASEPKEQAVPSGWDDLLGSQPQPWYQGNKGGLSSKLNQSPGRTLRSHGKAYYTAHQLAPGH